MFSRHPRIDEQTYNRIKKFCLPGVTYTDIARAFDVSSTTARKIAHSKNYNEYTAKNTERAAAKRAATAAADPVQTVLPVAGSDYSKLIADMLDELVQQTLLLEQIAERLKSGA